MATTNNLPGITNTYSFLTICKTCGKLKLQTFVNSNTGEEFKVLAFVDKHETPEGEPITYEDPVTKEKKQGYLRISFSQNLGELTPQELNEKRHDLQVVRLASGNYKLCNSALPGEDVSIILD